MTRCAVVRTMSTGLEDRKTGRQEDRKTGRQEDRKFSYCKPSRSYEWPSRQGQDHFSLC